MNGIEQLRQLLQYEVFRNALLAGAGLSLCAALLGVTLVLKRYSMIGDGLSHVGFGALSIAAACGLAPLWIAIPAVILAAFLLLRIRNNGKIRSDAAIALIASSSLAIGVTATALSGGTGTDVSSYMFGSILSVSKIDAILSLCLCCAVLIWYVFCYNRIFSVTFDESFFQATGGNASAYTTAFAVLTALTVVLGMRIMGTLLISSLIIFPALSAMRLCRSFRGTVLLSAGISLFCFFAGMLITTFTPTPAGAAVVLANLAVFLVCAVLGKLLFRRR